MENILFGLDKVLFALIDGSGFVLLTCLGILKILAKHTNFAPGSEIIEMLLGIVRVRKDTNKPDDKPIAKM